jgi:hypothetical protein
MSYALYDDYNDINNFDKLFYKTKSVVSSAEPNKSKSLQFINLKYYDKANNFHDIRYNRTPTNGIKYFVGDTVNIWVNKNEPEDIIIENAIEDHKNIEWLILVVSLMTMLGCIFWKSLKKLI